MIATSVSAITRARVLLADDYDPLLVVWRRLLEPDCEVVGSVRDGKALVDLAIDLKPDVIVADLSMPEMNGFDACRVLKRLMPEAKVVLVTAGGDEHLAQAAFRFGASAFVLKHAAADELFAAIQLAMLGEVFCSPSLSRRPSRLH